MKIRLKCWAPSWDAIRSGAKTCEVRSIDDRTFSVGDELILERFDQHTMAPAVPSGNIHVEITHITSASGHYEMVGIRMESPVGARPMVALVALSFRILTVLGGP